MYKFVAKIIAKRYLNKYKTDSKAVGVTNIVIKGVDLYKDLFIYTLLYFVVVIILWIGVPIGSYFLFNDNPIIWSFFIFMIMTIFLSIMTFKLVFDFVDSVRKEIEILYKTLKN